MVLSSIFEFLGKAADTISENSDTILKVGGGAIAATTVLTLTTAAASAAEGFVDNVFRDKINEPAEGSLVYCDLGITVEHSGIYVGNGEIVHLDGSGQIIRTGPRQFINRLGGLNPAISIYASCKDTVPQGSIAIKLYALSKLYNHVDYSFISNNCHRFSSECILRSTDVPSYSMTMKGTKINFWKETDAHTYRVWDFK